MPAMMDGTSLLLQVQDLTRAPQAMKGFRRLNHGDTEAQRKCLVIHSMKF
jgi:hypothetical protein